ncbi:hypothetical protein J5S49_10320 [Virgibacillus halodenitrificans]|uniref:hypothetical protein n=1 Tax=Virgibacillus halodenitrificans TaxID=1482 RepID=UPI001F1FAD66|nr:hypothetical protein [Virgibacillus halodenitrificans]MCG1028689.1 hypothetical protein [Virgibacillus halodenitrificans]
MMQKIDILRRNCKYCKLLFLKGTLLKYILIRFDELLSPLISITDERFPPAGVVIFHSNQLVCAID